MVGLPVADVHHHVVLQIGEAAECAQAGFQRE